MIGPGPYAYACANVDPVFTCQSYDISISTSTKNKLVRFPCAYAYAYVDPVFTCLHMCLYLCLSASENQALALTGPLLLSGRASTGLSTPHVFKY